MYLQLLNYVSYFLSTVFIAFLCFSLDWKMIKESWQKAEAETIPENPEKITKEEQELLEKFENKIEKATLKGQKPFEFNNRKTIVYGKDYDDAHKKHKVLKIEARAVKNQLRKEALSVKNQLKKV